MPEPEQRTILFLPVSSSKGMGEYVRSTAIAKAFVDKYPGTKIVFGLNKHAPFFPTCEFSSYPLSNTPTLCTKEVLLLVSELKPDLVVFDASGRARQLAYCKKLGIKTLFIAQHARKLSKGLSVGRIKNTDSIVVAQSELLTGDLSWYQKLKLKLYKKSPPAYVGPIFSQAAFDMDDAILSSKDLVKDSYVFINSGGGGNKILTREGSVAAAELFLKLAASLSSMIDLKIVVVMGGNYIERSDVETDKIKNEGADKKITVIKHCKADVFNVLVRNAHTLVLSGGSSLLQAISSGNKRIVAVPVANDQLERIASCAKYYGIRRSSPELSEIIAATREEVRKSRVEEGNQFEKMENGLNKTIGIIQQLLLE